MRILEKKIRLRISECDVNCRWRPGAMLTELQEAAGEHSAAMGCGHNIHVDQLLGHTAAAHRRNHNRIVSDVHFFDDLCNDLRSQGMHTTGAISRNGFVQSMGSFINQFHKR